MATRVSDIKLNEFTKQLSSFEQNDQQDLENFKETNGISMGPHYEVPNLTSMLYEFTNKEQDRVSQGFRIGNFVSLRDLPQNLISGNVITAQRDKIEKNLYSQSQPKTYVELQNGGGYFSKFDWAPEPFGLFLDQERELSRQHREKQNDLHEKPFKSNPYRSKGYKHQDQFWNANDGTVSIFFGEDDPYEATQFEVLRAKWESDSKILYGDFKPSNSIQSLKKVNKQHLPDIVGEIKRNIMADWSDINFIIGTDPEDFIELRFEIQSVDSPKGLQAYMNNLVNLNDLLIRYQLRRVSEFWGMKSEDEIYIYYMLAPHWVKIKNPILYLKQFAQQ